MFSVTHACFHASVILMGRMPCRHAGVMDTKMRTTAGLTGPLGFRTEYESSMGCRTIPQLAASSGLGAKSLSLGNSQCLGGTTSEPNTIKVRACRSMAQHLFDMTSPRACDRGETQAHMNGELLSRGNSQWACAHVLMWGLGAGLGVSLASQGFIGGVDP